MNLKRYIIRKLWGALSPDQQQVMIYDFLDWLYADLQPAQRQEKAKRLAPRLMVWVAEGEIGLSLVIYQHLSRLLSTLGRWIGEPKIATKKATRHLKW